MEQGSLGELVLTRSVIKHIKKQDKELVQGTGVGHDFAKSGSIITTEAVSATPGLSYVKALNNFYVSGGKPVMVRVCALLPEATKEGEIKEYMNCFNRLAMKEGVQLAGGHTEVSRSYNEKSFVVTVTGISGEYEHRKKLINPGCDIIMTGYAAMLGTDIILKAKGKELEKRFSRAYVGEASPWREEYSIRVAATCLSSLDNVYYMHDVSYGGVYGALWQLGAYLSKGISVGHFSIPILQSTIEFCELFSLNPYMLEGTGAMLAVTKEGSGTAICESLMEQGINACVIGHVEANNERMVYLGDALSVSVVEKQDLSEAVFFKDASDKYIERRCLSPVKGDEVYKVVERL